MAIIDTRWQYSVFKSILKSLTLFFFETLSLKNLVTDSGIRFSVYHKIYFFITNASLVNETEPTIFYKMIQCLKSAIFVDLILLLIHQKWEHFSCIGLYIKYV